MAQIVLDENISSGTIPTLFSLRPSWQQSFLRMRQMLHWEKSTDYSSSMWKNRTQSDRRIICSDCEAKDEKAKACELCRVSKEKSHYSKSMWKHGFYTHRKIICIECEAEQNAIEKTTFCDICKIAKPIHAFSDSANENKKKATQNSRCYDCSHPPCMFLPNCKTCVKCRDHKCRTSNCRKDIKTLNSMVIPATMEECQTFACERCKYLRCTVVQNDGNVCGKLRRLKTIKKARDKEEDYKCGDCQTWLLSRRILQCNKS